MRYKLIITSFILLIVYALIYLMPELSTFFVMMPIISVGMLVPMLYLQFVNNKNPIRCRNYLKLLMLMTTFMFFMTIIHMVFGIGDYSVSSIIQDLISMSILMSGFALTSKEDFNDEDLVKYLKLIGIIAVVSGLISLSLANFSTDRDANVWQPQYIWWGLLFPWSYLLLYKFIMVKKTMFWNVLAFGSTALYFILGLLFGKRIILYELVIVLLAISIATKKKSLLIKLLKAGLLLIASMVLVALFSYLVLGIDLIEIFNQTLMRFGDVSLKNFDRFDEFYNVFKQYPYTILATGAGLGSQQNGPGGINMHIGWLNFLFKGGLFFIAIELWVFSIAIKTLFSSKDRWTLFISACVVCSYFFILITSSWVASPITMNFSIMKFALLRITDVKAETGFKD